MTESRRAPGTAGPDGRRDQRDISATLRTARWVGVAFVIVQFWLYQPPPGTSLPFARVTAVLGVVAVLVATNAGSLLISRSRSDRLQRWQAPGETAIDSALVVGLIWLFSFDATSALWALLIIPVLEAALRSQLTGAVRAWAALGGVYIVHEAWASHAYADVSVDAASITYRLGIILLVAVATGSLARSMRERLVSQEEALGLSAHRAGLLRTVAAVSRELSVLEADALLEHVVDAAIRIGFDAAEICVYEGDYWRSTCGAGSLVRTGVEHKIGSGLAGAVWESRRTVVVDDYATWSRAVAPFAEAGFHVGVAVPIFAREHLVGALIGGTHAPALTSANQIESLELLAAQAGSSLATAEVLDRMRDQAMHDLLTGLPNERLLRDRALQAIRRAERDRSAIAFCFLDLDRFKKINDNLGHDTGDALLKQVAARLLGSVRASDTVARLGGDEFLVMLPDTPGPDEARRATNKIADALRRPFAVRGQEIYLTASIGIAMYPDDGVEPETLRKHADLAMYEAKARGRNVVERYHRALRMVPGALELEAELHRALEADEFVLHFQPECDIVTGEVVAVEALIRWHHPRLGLLQPAQFLHVADETDLLSELDTWVTRQAVAQSAAWYAANSPLRIAINISDATFRRVERLAAIASIIESAQLAPGLLEIEVTETVAAGELRAQIALLEQLRSGGVAITIDDFGIGYSMLGRLRDFPVDRLKIDRSFIAEITAATDDAPVVSAIVAMADKLGIEVVAEGVETAPQLEVARRLGCRYIQGFVLAHPVAVGTGMAEIRLARLAAAEAAGS